MKAVAIFLVSAALAVSGTPLKEKLSIASLPEVQVNHGKIVGGVEATPYEFNWIVDLRRGGGHYCGGSIVSEKWVVTAAHCAEASVSGYTIVAGDHNLQSIDGNEQTRSVVQIIRHPSYGTPLAYENDIALMQVDIPFEFNEFVQPVLLPPPGFDATSVATVAGWGALSEGGSSPTSLMKVDVPFVDDETCNQAYSGGVAQSMICYGEAGKDSCQGDSGGPIMCGSDRAMCGIVSWGRGCAREGFPGVYTETSYFTEWIEGHISPTEEDPAPISDVTSCGGFYETSSGTIVYSTGANVQAHKMCVWTIKVPYDTLRLNLFQSTLTPVDGLYVARYHAETGTTGNQTRLQQTGTNYTVEGGLIIITLDVTPGQPERRFILNFFSSGFLDTTPTLTAYASLNSTSGTFSYPSSGSYRNMERGLFVLSPEAPGDRDITFTSIDVESDSSCRYDAVAVYSWVNGRYNLMDRFCGRTVPEPFHLPGGAGLITFLTDDSVTGSGFTFDWQ